MVQFETDFQVRLDALESDARACAAFAYTEYVLRHRAGADPAVGQLLNEHKAFWWPILSALQKSTFLALGRIFDDDKATHNARELLKFAESHLGIFSQQALEARKIREGLDPLIAKKYAAAAYIRPRDGLAALRAELESKQDFYKSKLAPIRHQVYAHRARLSAGARDALFADLMLHDLEGIIVFTLQLERAVFKLYHDGREPILQPAPTSIGDVMQALPERHTSTWEHLHAAKDTSAFLDWLKANRG